MNSLKGVSGRALCALIGKLTAMEYLPYEHFRAFASQLVTHFRTERHLECLLAMFRYAASLRAEYFIEDEHFLLSVTKVLCIRSSAVFVREAPEVRIMHLLSLRFRFLTIFSFFFFFFQKGCHSPQQFHSSRLAQRERQLLHVRFGGRGRRLISHYGAVELEFDKVADPPHT